MKRTKIRMGLAIALTAVLLVFIWGNSLLPGEVSGAFSQWVKDLLSRLFGFFQNVGMVDQVAYVELWYAVLFGSEYLAGAAQPEVFLSDNESVG